MTGESIKARLVSEFNFLEADKALLEVEHENLKLYFLKSGKKIKVFQFDLSNKAEINSIIKEGLLTAGTEVAISDSGSSKISRAAPLVLIVEDDPDQREILTIMLKDLKYEVMVAQNGEEALSLSASNVPDLIITDLMMPKMDGSEFIKKIKRNPAYQSIPILVLTVLADSEREYSLLNLGVDDYCQKTMPRKVLTKRIENLVTRHLQSS